MGNRENGGHQYMVSRASSVGNHAARHTLRILPVSLDSFWERALPSGMREKASDSGMRRLRVWACVCTVEESIS